ncbi:MAG TPA: hypothetical protein VFD58_04575 [Blastocatellia bacterium]|nr:hypothetical protein [Blastocatellia bacterium]
MPEVDKQKPALIGGLIVGLLSSLPIVSIGNACCCMWALIGGAVAAKMLIDRSPQRVKAGDGAMIGVMAGGIGAGISLIIGIPLALIMGPAFYGIARRVAEMSNDPNLQQAVQQMTAQMGAQSFGQRLLSSVLSGVIMAVLLIGFTTLGGLLGVAIFEKRKDQTPPPPPQYPPQYPPQNPPPGDWGSPR